MTVQTRLDSILHKFTLLVFLLHYKSPQLPCRRHRLLHGTPSACEGFAVICKIFNNKNIMKKMKDEPTEDLSLTPNAHTGLGDFIAWLQKNIPIDHSLLSGICVARRSGISRTTYVAVKKGLCCVHFPTARCSAFTATPC